MWRAATSTTGCCNGAPSAAAALLRQIAEGLLAVHARGILHRDLKPQNVLVRPSAQGFGAASVPTLLVADFGISRRTTTGAASITQVAGTPGYAAPEVWSGATLTGAVDVYGLGAIGWFLLTAKDPEPAIGRTHLDPRDLRELLDPMTQVQGAGLLTLLEAMLTLSPNARPLLPEVYQRLVAAAAPPLPPSPGRTRSLPLLSPPAVGSPTIIPEVPRSVLDEPAPEPGRGIFLLVVAGLLALVLCAGIVVGGYSAFDRPEAAPVVATPPVPPISAPPPTNLPPEEPVAPDLGPEPASPLPTAVLAVPDPVATPVRASPASPVSPIVGGPIARLRIGIDAPNGLPADVLLSVIAPGARTAESRSTQVVVMDTTSGTVTIAVRSATRTLAQAVVEIPPGDEVRVLCKALSADFAGMACAVRP